LKFSLEIFKKRGINLEMFLIDNRKNINFEKLERLKMDLFYYEKRRDELFDEYELAKEFVEETREKLTELDIGRLYE
jgi:hypothetical protein